MRWIAGILVCAGLMLAGCHTGGGATGNQGVQIVEDGELKVTLEGTVYPEMFSGPAGYGEMPEADVKEMAFILVLDHAISFREKDKSVVEGVREVQVVYPAGVKPKPGRQVFSGQVQGWETGHHRRRVMYFLDREPEPAGEGL